MPEKYTADQIRAITERGTETVVSAAAGSGKTSVLVERVIRYILDGHDIDKLLIVTFTNKAAAEMKERIVAALSCERQKNPDNVHVIKQSMLIHNARICTIDSFYISLVRTYFQDAGVAPDFKLAGDEEIKVLTDETVNLVLEELYSEGGKAFFALADCFSSESSDTQLVNLILNLHRQMMNQPFPEEWISSIPEMYRDREKLSAVLTYTSQIIAEELEGYIVKYNTALKKCTDIPEQYNILLPLFEDEMKILKSAINCLYRSEWDEARTILCEYSFPTFPTKRGYADHPAKQYAKSVRESLKDFVIALPTKLMCVNSENFYNDAKVLYPIIETLCNTVMQYHRELEKAKKQKNLYTFADIAVYTLKLLSKKGEKGELLPSETAKQVSSMFDEILIDEYQDTNASQDYIFSLISDSRKKLFVVGDIKQSIYRFRNACPDIFIDLLDRGTKDGVGGPRLITLADNFRSSRAVIDTVNYFFDYSMCRQLGEIEYDKKQRLIDGRKAEADESCKTEIYFLDYDKKRLKEYSDDELSKYEIEAQFVADKIKNMISHGFQIYDKATNEYRNATFSDFAVLLRNLKGMSALGSVFEKVFKRNGIPVMCEESGESYDKYEIELLLSLLKIIDNPYNDVALASVLISPFFGFTPDKLADIRLKGPKKDYYSAIKDYAQADQKAQEFLEKISQYRAKSKNIPIYRFLLYLYADLNMPAVFGAMDGGKLRQKNLQHLCNFAKEYENRGIGGLYGFISYIDDMISSGKKIGDAKGVTEIDAVNIVSMHKSKGLEFPVCFVCCLGSEFNLMDTGVKTLIHKSLGLSTKILEPGTNAEYTTVNREFAVSMIKQERLSEEMRLLYVAMTRARDKLILTSAYSKLNERISNVAMLKCGGPKLSPVDMRKLKTPGEWLMAAFLGHKDGVELRIRSGMDINTDEANFEVKINVVSFFLNDAETGEEDVLAQPNNEIDLKKQTEAANELRGKIAEALDFEYSRSVFSQIPEKLSVSEIKGNFIPDETSEILYKPSVHRVDEIFSGKGSSGKSTGTAVHKLLEYIDFNSADRQSVEDMRDRLAQRHIIFEEDAKNIDIKAIMNFLQSNMVKRIKKAEYCEKEYRFTAEEDVSVYREIPTDALKGETFLLQGVIDCFFIEDGELVLIDYKTDKAENRQVLADRYSLQMKLYKSALQKIFKKKVKETIIYSLYLGEEIYL